MTDGADRDSHVVYARGSVSGTGSGVVDERFGLSEMSELRGPGSGYRTALRRRQMKAARPARAASAARPAKEAPMTTPLLTAVAAVATATELSGTCEYLERKHTASIMACYAGAVHAEADGAVVAAPTAHNTVAGGQRVVAPATCVAAAGDDAEILSVGGAGGCCAVADTGRNPHGTAR